MKETSGNGAQHISKYQQDVGKNLVKMDKWIEESAAERMVWQAADWSAFQEKVDSTLRSWAC